MIIGHSVGGFIARYYAKKYPEDVIGLFLIDPYQEMGKEEFGEWPHHSPATPRNFSHKC
ncbi:MAG: alpha/beta fold hydrolase [Saprospiraceae bacterium]